MGLEVRYRSRGLVYQLHTFDELSDTAFWSVDGTMELLGSLQSLDWTGGLDRWTGLVN